MLLLIIDIVFCAWNEKDNYANGLKKDTIYPKLKSEIKEIFYVDSMVTVDIIGVSGVALVTVAYLMLQIEKMDSKGFLYSFLNAFGSAMILYSLAYNWNLASFVIEFFWILISSYGLWKWYSTRSQK